MLTPVVGTESLGDPEVLGCQVVSLSVVIAAITEVLDARRDDWGPVEIDTPLDDLGLDSLDLAELLVALEEKVGFELDQELSEAIETVGDLTRLRAAEEERTA